MFNWNTLVYAFNCVVFWFQLQYMVSIYEYNNKANVFCTFSNFSATRRARRASDSSFESSFKQAERLFLAFWFSGSFTRKSGKTSFSHQFSVYPTINWGKIQFFGCNFWLRPYFSMKMTTNDSSRDSASDSTN